MVLSCGEDEKIPIKKLRQSLLILIKHHLVITEVLPEDVSQATSFSKIEMSGLVYRVDLISVIRRLKYGQMLQYTSSHYSHVAEILVENLMVHGSMTITQLISTMLLDPRVNADEEELKLTFNKLVQDRFVILHPPLEVKTRSQAQAFQTISAAARTVNSILAINAGAGSASSSAAVAAAAAALSADGKKGPVKRGRKATGAAATSDATSFLPAELRAAAAAASQPAAAPTAIPAAIDESAPAAKKRRIVRGTAAAAAAVSSGIGHGATSATGSGPEVATPMLSDSVVNPDSRWKVGVEQFLKIQKHKVCVEFIQEQCGGLAEVIAKVVLKQSIQQEVDAHAPRSMTFSLFELQQSLKEHQASTSSGAATIPTDFATLRDVLEVMRHSSIKAILKVSDELLCLHEPVSHLTDTHTQHTTTHNGLAIGGDTGATREKRRAQSLRDQLRRHLRGGTTADGAFHRDWSLWSAKCPHLGIAHAESVSRTTSDHGSCDFTRARDT